MLNESFFPGLYRPAAVFISVVMGGGYGTGREMIEFFTRYGLLGGLLGNVLRFQESFATGKDETIMYNSDGELTEASSSNVFIVKPGTLDRLCRRYYLDLGR